LDVYESASTTLDSGTAVCTDVGIGYDNDCHGITTASYVDMFSTPSNDSPQDVVFSNDGTKMFLTDHIGLQVEEHTCTAWDASTCSAVDTLSISGQTSNPRGLEFSTDGFKLFVANADATATILELDIETVQGSAGGIEWSVDGTKFFGFTSFIIYEYSCEPFDISTCVFVDETDTQATGGGRMSFSNDGTKLYLAENTTPAVVSEYICSPWDASTCLYVFICVKF
jgi:WD40 repeat protein